MAQTRHIAELLNQTDQSRYIPQNGKEAYLWRADKPGAGSIFIFNTRHELMNIDPQIIFRDAWSKVLRQVDTVYTEVEFDLSERPTSESYGQITIHYPDVLLAKIAANQGKALKYLETEDDRMLNGLDMQEVKAIYEERIQRLKSGDPDLIETEITATKAYLTKNDNSFMAFAPLDLKKSTAARNKNWVEILSMASAAKNSGILVVCGSAHSWGQFGLPNLLAKQGYRLTPLLTEISRPHRHDAYLQKIQREESSVFNQIKQRIRLFKPSNGQIKNLDMPHLKAKL